MFSLNQGYSIFFDGGKFCIEEVAYVLPAVYHVWGKASYLVLNNTLDGGVCNLFNFKKYYLESKRKYKRAMAVINYRKEKKSNENCS